MTEQPSLPVPDAIAPLIGYKIFRVESGHGKVTVHSLIYSHVVWQPNTEQVASCSMIPPGGSYVFTRSWTHPAPKEGCECGIYSLKNSYACAYRFSMYMPVGKNVVIVDGPDALERHNHFYVMAKMDVWGKVIVGEQGYRSEKAKIKTFYVDDRYTFLRHALEDQYQTPVESVNPFLRHTWLSGDLIR